MLNRCQAFTWTIDDHILPLAHNELPDLSIDSPR